MSLGEAVVMAGYAESSRKDPRKLIVTKGVKSLRDAYLFEVSSKITPRIVAKRVQQGVKSPDLKVALEYIKEYKKDFGISTDTATNAIQINLTGDITDLANWSQSLSKFRVDHLYHFTILNALESTTDANVL